MLRHVFQRYFLRLKVRQRTDHYGVQAHTFVFIIIFIHTSFTTAVTEVLPVHFFREVVFYEFEFKFEFKLISS